MKRLIAVIMLTFICLHTPATYGGKAEALFENAAPAGASLASIQFTKLFINEFMADNKTTVKDADDKSGSFEDWIELYNADTSAIDLGGIYLTDNLTNPTKWQVPVGVIIPSGGYLLFWADEDEKQGNTHTNFKLSKDGEAIAIIGKDGVTVIDSIAFGAQIIDVSYGRYPNGKADWGFMKATPGAANNLHNAPPEISGTMHAPPSPAKTDQVFVTATVTDKDGAVADVTLTYMAAGSKAVIVRMYDDGTHSDAGAGDGLFGAGIPAFGQDTVLNYSITATDNLGAQSTAPPAAPKVTFTYVVGYTPPLIYINEFMADSNASVNSSMNASVNSSMNTSRSSINVTHNTANGTTGNEDWIELYNGGTSSVDLGGMYLTDKLADRTQWRIPEGVTIPADGHLLFWADGNNEQGSMHASFKLSKDGEAIGLFDTDVKGNMPVDTVTFGEQVANLSCGRIYDGAEPWVLSENATPGTPNFFPAGMDSFIWKFSYIIDSYTIIQKFPGSVNAIKGMNTDSDQWEAAYPLWGNPAGVHFPVMPDGIYYLSVTSPNSVCFKGNVFSK
ncbi:MAG: lamin tail domain-containing protein [bacterium]